MPGIAITKALPIDLGDRGMGGWRRAYPATAGRATAEQSPLTRTAGCLRPAQPGQRIRLVVVSRLMPQGPA